MEQQSFKMAGGIAANLAIMEIKSVRNREVVKRLREYVDVMHRTNHKVPVIRVKKDDYECLLKELNKSRPPNSADFVSINWDGIPVKA